MGLSAYALEVAVLSVRTIAAPTFTNAIIVDPTSGVGNYTKIQAAINSISSDNWTILIYPGVYNEAVNLNKPNVTLKGIDRDAVVIHPPNGYDGVTVTGSGSRHNTIRDISVRVDDPNTTNLAAIRLLGDSTAHATDITLDNLSLYTSGHLQYGIQFGSNAAISTVASSPLLIRNVIIRTTGFTGRAIWGQVCDGIFVSNSDILTGDGQVQAGDNTGIIGSSIVCSSSYSNPTTSRDDTAAVTVLRKTNVQIVGCKLQGRESGIETYTGTSVCEPPTSVTVTGSLSWGTFDAVHILSSDRVAVVGCAVLGSSAFGHNSGLPTPPDYRGVLIGVLPAGCTLGSVRIVGCDINAHSEFTTTKAVGVEVTDAPSATAGPVQIVGCRIAASSTGTGQASYGVYSTAASAVAVQGGTISVSANQRVSNVYDVVGSSSQVQVLASGAQFSNWSGLIGPAKTLRVVEQRVAGVAAPSNTAILNSLTLTGSEQTVTTGLTSPDVYRAVRVTFSSSVSNAPVYIIGTDAGGESITELVTVTGTSAEGVRPFKTVNTVIVPSGTGTVSIGTNTKLGLESPLASTSDLLQVAKQASGATYYTNFTGSATPDLSHGTIDVGSITAGDNFEFTYKTAQ
jgi:hypothetical protein